MANRFFAQNNKNLAKIEEDTKTVEKGRRLEIDRAKGLAITLVVWGHLASLIAIDFPRWYLLSITTVYSFHMPLFMYLSGFVYFLASHQSKFFCNPISYTLARFDRLIVPFFTFGVTVVIGKYLLNDLARIPDPVESLGSGVVSVFSNAAGNPAAAIWYLLILFYYTFLTPLLWKLGKNSVALIIFASIAFQFADATEAYYLDRFFFYYIFFAAGGFVANNCHRACLIFKKHYILFISVFLIAICNFSDSSYSMLVCGLTSIPAIHGLFLQDFWNSDRILLMLGRSSMVVYLLNTIVIGVCGVALHIYGRGKEFDFAPLGIAILVIALILPIAIRKLLEAIGAPAKLLKYLQ